VTKRHTGSGPDDTLPADRAGVATVSNSQPSIGSQTDETVPASVQDLALGSPASADELLTAEHPNRYQIQETLGAGGIGVVHLAYDRHLDREIALKELRRRPSSGSGSPQLTTAESRFLLEARVTGRLEHSAIVPVHEVGKRRDGSIYYTMKRVRGRTLGEALKDRDLRGRLELLPNLLDLCYAIAYAHSRGVIHRDLKPDNVLLGEFGETVVLDWGLAKVHDSPAGAGGEISQTLRDLASSVSAGDLEGAPVGTPAYMPPEQARGEHSAVDERSDIFSLGAILYEFLTGQPPFRGSSALETIVQAREKPITPPHQLEPACPPELAAIAIRALDRDPTRRYADARTLAADVLAFQTGGLVTAHRYAIWTLLWRWVRLHRRSLSIALFLIVAAGAAWWYRGYADEQKRIRAEAPRQAAVRRPVDGLLSRAAAGGARAKRWLESYAFRLIGLREELVEDRLIAALGDEHPEVRRLAARALGGMGSRRAVPALTRRLGEAGESSQDGIVEIINALGIIGDSRAEEAVAAARWRSGFGSQLWRNTRLAYEMIPLPPLVDGGARMTGEAWHRRGRALENKGDPQGALLAYGRAIALDPRAWRSLNNRGNVLKALGDLKGALADFDRAILIAEGDPAPYINRAHLRRRFGDVKGALADIDIAVASHRSGGISLRVRASLRQTAGDLEGALADLEQAAKIDARNPQSFSAMGDYWIKRGDFGRALASYDRALALGPDDVSALINRAYIHQVQGRNSAALDDLDRALSLDPTDRAARRQRANVRLLIGHRNGARRDLDRNILSDPKDGVRWAHRGVIYGAQTGDLRLASADLEEAVRRADRPSRQMLEILALGVAVLRDEPERQRQHLQAIAGLTTAGRHQEQLQRLFAGKLSDEEVRAIAGRTTLLDHRVLLLFASGLRAELAKDRKLAREHYAAAVAVPRPNNPEGILARLLLARFKEKSHPADRE